MSDLARFTTAELQQMHTDLYKSATALYDKSDAAFNRGRVSMTPRPALADLLAAAAAAREQHELMTAVNDELQARYAAQEASRGLPEADRRSPRRARAGHRRLPGP